MDTKYINYQKLELIPPSTIETDRPSSFLTRVAHYLRQLSIPSPQTAIPFIWKTTDAAGQTRWNVFDRLTGQTLCLMSDEKFCDWLEQRYYQ